jgi:hypothetical protein
MSYRDHLNLTTLTDTLVIVFYDRAKSDEDSPILSPFLLVVGWAADVCGHEKA